MIAFYFVIGIIIGLFLGWNIKELFYVAKLNKTLDKIKSITKDYNSEEVQGMLKCVFMFIEERMIR